VYCVSATISQVVQNDRYPLRTGTRYLNPFLSYPEFETLLCGAKLFSSVELHRLHGTKAEGIVFDTWFLAFYAILAFLRVAYFNACSRCLAPEYFGL
jgi:hypothetical protein